ncbi:hypothetical protein JDN40_01000 [Rhodomicrobium vannielii ATCC 17100]|uniref:hypothetical protein n=1 Tax=Rhodomicrobium vannielii TaxID=1069 RepID=UPI00191AF03B|nr:hypothetical protein [Rhodomicrobium vannielii]MBJ7532702.1 hypothetical protein [Rhodomicrobium vannielii ATCC 17100]
MPALYQTLAILVIALALHTAALAVGPVRVRLLQIGPRVEESARSFGYSAPAAFRAVTLPALSQSVLAGATSIAAAALDVSGSHSVILNAAPNAKTPSRKFLI